MADLLVNLVAGRGNAITVDGVTLTPAELLGAASAAAATAAGAVELLSQKVDCSVINAGDGSHERLQRRDRPECVERCALPRIRRGEKPDHVPQPLADEEIHRVRPPDA